MCNSQKLESHIHPNHFRANKPRTKFKFLLTNPKIKRENNTKFAVAETKGENDIFSQNATTNNQPKRNKR